MLSDHLRFAVMSLSSRGVRTWLTMLGIFIGIAAVVSLISLGQGLQNYINEEFQKIGVNRVIITPGGGGGGVGGIGMSQMASARLTDSDVDAVLKVRGVNHAIGMLRRTVKVTYRGEAVNAFMFGVEYSPETVDVMRTIDFWTLDEGRYPRVNENYKVLMASKLAHEGFNHPLERGKKIRINDVDFEVTGFTKVAGDPANDVKIGVPLSTMRQMFGLEDDISQIMAETHPTANVTEVAEEIRQRLRRARGVREGEEDFSVTTAEEIMESFNTIIGVVQTILGGIAAISLLVGGLGIMTTMYTSVIERTRQIGIMKAVGAKKSDILSLFVIEAGILGLIGGLIGVMLGLTISFSAAYVAETYYESDLVKASAQPSLIIGALAFSFIIGCVSGILPARNAANMRPVDAIKK
jgi:putative ABC transport system permease protein